MGSIDFERHFARFEALPDNLSEPLALRYHGHQFRQYNPYLGDGRGFLFAQVRDRRGRLLDLGTKGSGTTPYSRGGDGRLTLKGAVREILATELLEARGVDTSKTLSVVETGEALERHDEPSPTRSAVLVRLSHGHIRIGTFQRLYTLGQREALARLLAHAVELFFPSLAGAPDLPAAFLAAVAAACADTAAAWMVAGFVHGVLNTDNINITGESFDYGPWRFVPTCDPQFTAAYFDHSGLYAFGRQAASVAWNLEQLAASLQSLGTARSLAAALGGFKSAFAGALVRRTIAALGVCSMGEKADQELADAWWHWLESSRVDFDRAWFDWYGGTASVQRASKSPDAEHYRKKSFEPVAQGFETFAPRAPERLAHPDFARERPVTLVIDVIESLWQRIAEHDDWSAFDKQIAEIRELGEAYG